MIHPEISGPTQAIRRGMLNTKPAAVARMRVGNSSGSHADIQVYCPETNTPENPGHHQQHAEIMGHEKHDRHGANAMATKNSVTGLRP